MKEQLSALIDGEFDVDNANHLLLGAMSNGELKQAWVHYHLIGDTIRGDNLNKSDMTNRVLAALESEPTVIAPKNVSQAAKNPSRNKQSIYWSVAASVAAVFFVGLMLMQQQVSTDNELTPIQIADNMPDEYLNAHHTHAPNGVSYYIQNASFAEQRR